MSAVLNGSTSSAPSKGRPKIQVDASTFDPRKIGPVTHNLVGHPLLTIESLLRLSKRLKSPGRFRFHAGSVAADTDFHKAPDMHSAGLSVERILENVEKAGAWLAFHYIQADPEYGALVDELLDGVLPVVNPVDPGMWDRAGWIFISSPGATTPYHMDHENNFLMQVSGSKHVSVWDPYDRQVVTEEALELFLGGYSLDKVKYTDAIQPRSFSTILKPGEGVYMPSTGPHLVRNGDEVSITISVTYRTAATRRRAMIYSANRAMRLRGMTPKPYGQSPLRDSLVHGTYGALTAVKKLVKKEKAAAAEEAHA